LIVLSTFDRISYRFTFGLSSTIGYFSSSAAEGLGLLTS